ncbi:apolipoprotein N-acyltransferase [Alphaproteobacteria bacterium]|nr:apolipoprotein N-acyltransferase [Alphaproteobacteria bacterium]
MSDLNHDIQPVFAGFFSILTQSVLLGALSSLAMPPYGYWWALMIGLSGLYWLLLRSSNKKRAFLCGWGFGFGYFVFGLSWIGNALLVEGNDYAWAWPLAVVGLPLALAIFTGVGTLASWRFFNLQSVVGLLAMIGCMSLAEWLRGNLFTGFPWNLYGYTWFKHLEIIQVLRAWDVYFLSFLTMLWLLTPIFVLIKVKTGARMLYTLVLLLLSLSTFGITLAYGHLKLKEDRMFDQETIVKIVQPNIKQSEKWDPDKLDQHFVDQVQMSSAGGGQDSLEGRRTIIVWPETALNYRVLQDPLSSIKLKSALQSYAGNTFLLSGLLNYHPENHTYTNSLIAIDQQGIVKSVYDKSHLVPFGEYIPFQKLIPLTPVAQFSGFVKGAGIEVVNLSDNLSYVPLICYEIIFPGRIKEQHDADFIVNVTNDGWYGDSAGPHQHFVMAQYRAVETGIPVVRVANTGISGTFDSYGRLVDKINLMEKKVISISLPAAEELFFPFWKNQPLVFPMLLLILCSFGYFFRFWALN